MIKVKIITNAAPTIQDIVDENATLRQVLTEKGVDYSRQSVTIDGCVLQPGDIDKSFADFGIATETILTALAKLDNA